MRTNPAPTAHIYRAFRDGIPLIHGPRGGRLPGSLYVLAGSGLQSKGATLYFHDSAIVQWEPSKDGKRKIVSVDLAGWGHSPCTREAINRALAILDVPFSVNRENGFIVAGGSILPWKGMAPVWPYLKRGKLRPISGPSNAVIRRQCKEVIPAPSGGFGDWHRWKIREKTIDPECFRWFIVSAFRWNIYARAVEVLRFRVNGKGLLTSDPIHSNEFLPRMGRN